MFDCGLFSLYIFYKEKNLIVSDIYNNDIIPVTSIVSP